MPAREPSWNEVLDTVLTSRLRSVHTSLPGTIRSYDAATQTAQVELAVQLEGAAGAFERVPPLADVPVLLPGAWAAGDKCLLIFAEEDPSKWWATDGATIEPPAVQQRHGLHATCIVLVDGTNDAAQFVALANLADAQFAALETALTAWQAALETVSTSTPAAPVTALILTNAVKALNTLLGASWPASVAAAKVKAV